jgi:hypothetical protein
VREWDDEKNRLHALTVLTSRAAGVPPSRSEIDVTLS